MRDFRTDPILPIGSKPDVEQFRKTLREKGPDAVLQKIASLRICQI